MNEKKLLYSEINFEEFLFKLISEKKITPLIANEDKKYHQIILKHFDDTNKPSLEDYISTLWKLILKGLVYIDFSNRYPPNWKILLTERGSNTVNEIGLNPDFPEEYMKELNKKVNCINETALFFTNESLQCYNARCYPASAVMLGVASESVFYELAVTFGDWKKLDDGDRESFHKKLFSNSNFISKFIEFKKKIEKYKSAIPHSILGNMAINLDAVLNLLRINRNESGHPTGNPTTRDEAFLNLRIFGIYLEYIYKQKSFFCDNKVN